MELQWSPFSMENTFQDSQQSHPRYSQETQLLCFFPLCQRSAIYSPNPTDHTLFCGPQAENGFYILKHLKNTRKIISGHMGMM